MSKTIPKYEDVATAPVVFFDVVPLHGILNDAIQVELAHRILMLSENGEVETKLATAGRLRCTAGAAKALVDALNGALAMLENSQKTQVSSEKLN